MSLRASIPASPSLGMGGGRAHPGSPLGAHCHPCAACLEPITAPLLHPPHPVPRGGTAPRLCLSLTAPTCRALCRVPGPGMVTVSFGREKGTCDPLHQCWVLPNLRRGAGGGELAQRCEAREGRCPQPGHQSRALHMAAARPRQAPRQHPVGRVAPAARVSPAPSLAVGPRPGCDAMGPPELGDRSAPLGGPHPCSHQGGLASPSVH